MPHARQLNRGLRELRFSLRNVAQRITFWVDHERNVIMLTTFRKQRQVERHEVDRALAAMDRCRNEHDH